MEVEDIHAQLIRDVCGGRPSTDDMSLWMIIIHSHELRLRKPLPPRCPCASIDGLTMRMTAQIASSLTPELDVHDWYRRLVLLPGLHGVPASDPRHARLEELLVKLRSHPDVAAVEEEFPRRFVIRAVKLRPELLPVPIQAGIPPKPLEAAWVGIVQTPGRDDVHIVLYSARGEELECIGADGVDAARDRAKRLLGVLHHEWLPCDVAVAPDDSVQWADVIHMPPAPRRLGDAETLLYAIVGDGIRSTGKCAHETAGERVAPARGLAIVRHSNQQGVYLFGCDHAWRDMTDTWHETVQLARDQGDAEYDGLVWLVPP